MHPHPQPASATVAVLDDDIRFIRMVERVLWEEDVAILPVTTIDLDEAVRVVGESRCVVALVDIFMYGHAAGFDLIEKLRSDPLTARLPILVTSGARREVGKRVAFLQEHHCSLLLKPFAADDLIAQIRACRASIAAPALSHTPPETAPALQGLPSVAPAAAWSPSMD